MFLLRYREEETSVDPRLRKIINKTLIEMKIKREAIEDIDEDNRKCNACNRYFPIEKTFLIRYREDSKRRHRLCLDCMKKLEKIR